MNLIQKREEFYKSGFLVDSFKDDSDLKKLQEILFDIYKGKIKEGFELIRKEKYKNAGDLRPHPLSKYDPIFVDILKNQNILETLRIATTRDLVLSHIKIRINYPAQAGYTGWHRDTSFYNGTKKGFVPPVINIHYYPNFEEKPEPTLLVWPGTHRKQYDNFWADRLQVMIGKKEKILTDNSKFVIIDTSAIHDVAPTTYKEGALRLMYSFCDKSQLVDVENPETQIN